MRYKSGVMTLSAGPMVPMDENLVLLSLVIKSINPEDVANYLALNSVSFSLRPPLLL